ncbi:type IV secretory system conjugative DNA transfer family protein [Paenibacillus sp. Root52]|uniref:type IV secretory system conjugative DNA transfer family protein n=1 Tax=Paenibacillus sp. Root52 TaxID=1736552 RepID=UPI000A3F4622|nr:type IV secretory system conjugative DNA transfer family protein [Paenibacillus sp. Root52]
MAKKNGSKNWNQIKNQKYTDRVKNREVHETQNMIRGKRGEVDKPIKERILAIIFASFFAGLGYIVGACVAVGWQFYRFIGDSGGTSFLDYQIQEEIFTNWKLLAWTGVIFLMSWLIINDRMMALWRSKNSMNDATDINTYENDQHIALPEEMRRLYDWFPDVGAESSVQVSSMLSHVMLSNKGLKSIDMVQRYKEDIKENGVIVALKGEIIYDANGQPVIKKVPIVDEEFGGDLFTASGIPVSEKEIRTPVDVRKIEYNEFDESGQRRDRDKLPYDTVSELINNDWTFLEHEVQRPAGAYLVDTAPVNTMVLAITRAGKGQTVIEPTIDMWTREKRKNNIVVNDPKGELLVKFYVPATIRGYEITQFNLINPLNTDIYNPLGFAAESAREGDFTKAASYIENIGDIFFPKEGADDPMWPNAANNAFKRSSFGLIDFYLEEEQRIRKQAEVEGWLEKKLMQTLDDLWGAVSLYNSYQLFVNLSAKKSTNLEMIRIDEDDGAKEKDLLTLFFDATAKLPTNEMRKLVQNADNALRAMAGSDKTIASVYGIALTAMSFFTDPTISTLTSGKPSQNFDAKGLSFPRRIGVRFASEYLEKYRLIGLQSVWSAYEDPNFEKQLDQKLFGHTQIIDRQGWARYFFDGKFPNRKSYVKLEIRNPATQLLVRTFYFEVELTYKTDLSGRRYVKDPVLNTKIIKDGALREMRFNRKLEKYEYKDTLVKRRYHDLLNPELGEQLVEIQAFSQKTVKYSERPKAIFFITPPHLMSYAKLILILIKQMVDVNFEGSYMTKDNQKPLYKTRYMLDEVGNLQSEGNGIPALQTMLSIGLGQDQQFTLILQTLQQLRDVYGESVDKIIQGNTENIVFLKSTDDSMIDTLVKMSGTTHESRVDQKTITRDNDRILYQNEGKISFTMQTKERPVLQFNDFMFIEARNSIIIKAGTSPIWNRNESAYPMSFRLFQNQISLPGKKFSLQTIPTNSSAKDFDVRKNQPDFFDMLEQRLRQAKMADRMKQAYLDAYDLSETDLIRLDQNVVADDIMHAINSRLYNISHRPAASDASSADRDQIPEMDEFGTILDMVIDNTEIMEEAAKAQNVQSDHQHKRYAGGQISREDLISIGGQVNRQLDKVLAIAYAESKVYFEDAWGFRTTDNGDLESDDGILYVRSSNGADKADIDALNDAERNEESRVFGDENTGNETFYEVTDAFIKYLSSLDSWRDLAQGRFDQEANRAYQRRMQ